MFCVYLKKTQDMGNKKTHTGINKQVNKKDLEDFKDLLKRRRAFEEGIALGYRNLQNQESELARVLDLYGEVVDAVNGQLKAWEEMSGKDYELDLEEGVLVHPDNIESWAQRKENIKNAKD